MDETITKVFTKYDPIITGIHFPAIKPIEASPLTDNSKLTVDDIITIDIPYSIADVEQGLEGVMFVHYTKAGNKAGRTNG